MTPKQICDEEFCAPIFFRQKEGLRGESTQFCLVMKKSKKNIFPSRKKTACFHRVEANYDAKINRRRIFVKNGLRGHKNRKFLFMTFSIYLAQKRSQRRPRRWQRAADGQRPQQQHHPQPSICITPSSQSRPPRNRKLCIFGVRSAPPFERSAIRMRRSLVSSTRTCRGHGRFLFFTLSTLQWTRGA